MTVDKWDQRQLCPDGGCVGVIGMDGKCKVCGTAAPDWGDPRKPGRVSSKAEDDELDESADHAPTEVKPTAEERAKKTWTSRQLCVDGTCVGVIGADGKCKVCGKAADLRAAVEQEHEDEYEDDNDEDDDEDEDEDEDDDDDESADSESDDDAEEIDDGGEGDDDEDDGVDETDSDDDSDDESDDDDDESDDDESDDEPDNRKLCTDGACVGVIGVDGKCKVCGKAAA